MSSHAPATSSRCADARTAAEGTTAVTSAAGKTVRTSSEDVQLETSREADKKTPKPSPEPAATRRAPGAEAGDTHVKKVAAEPNPGPARAPASASRGAPTSGPIVPTRHADAGTVVAVDEKTSATASPTPPSSVAASGANVTAAGVSKYANAADSTASAASASRARSEARSASNFLTRVSPKSFA